jgi:hypothetical protein
VNGRRHHELVLRDRTALRLAVMNGAEVVADLVRCDEGFEPGATSANLCERCGIRLAAHGTDIAESDGCAIEVTTGE